MATADQMKDWRWRVSNLYTIADEEGRVIPFRPNGEQIKLMDTMHNRNVILKARQLGFSTLIQIMGLDTCLFHANTNMGVIAQDLPTAGRIFREKIKDVYERLPDSIRALRAATQNSERAMEFSNKSRIWVDTSMRSGTLQFLHVSELGKIAAKYPGKAREIKTGAFPTVHSGQHIFVESTAEGQGGLFHEMVMTAREREDQGLELTPLEFKLHFVPWWNDNRYRIKTDRTIPAKHQAYFAELKRQHGIELDIEQQRWYSQQALQQGEDMRREFPSYLEEAFEAPIEGAYYTEELRRAREQLRIGDYPFDPKLGAVYTFWDLGRSDLMTIWLAQRVGASRWRFFDYVQGQDESFPHYARVLRERQNEHGGWVYGGHFLPHDGARTDISAAASRKTTLENLHIFPVHIVKRTKDLSGPALTSSINLVKAFMDLCAFDRVGCAEGLKHLANYRREWDDKLAIWKTKPFHNQASDGSDGYRTAAEADYQGLLDREMYGDDYDAAAENRLRHADEHTGY
jgi:hypothetical protein